MTGITYVTRVALPSRAAQAGQIADMSRAFHRVLGERFRLICASPWEGERASFDFPCEQRRPHRPSILRQLQFCAAAAGRTRTDRDSVVFTRDIGIAVAVVATGGRAVFEAHRAPTGAALWMTRRLATCDRASVVAISAALRDHYVDRCGFPPDRVLAAHDGVFPERYRALAAPEKQALRRELGLPSDAFLVVHTGSLHKGGAELFERVAAAPVPGIVMLQVGGADADRERWARHYAERGLTNVRFVPHTTPENARRYQAVADVLLYLNSRTSPIHWCTSPLKLFEYMASGAPILGAAIGSVREVIDESNAFCFDPDEPDGIAAQLARIVGDPADAARRAARARNAAETEHTWVRRAERIVAFADAQGGRR